LVDCSMRPTRREWVPAFTPNRSAYPAWIIFVGAAGPRRRGRGVGRSSRYGRGLLGGSHFRGLVGHRLEHAGLDLFLALEPEVGTLLFAQVGGVPTRSSSCTKTTLKPRDSPRSPWEQLLLFALSVLNTYFCGGNNKR
jgi:hypothetical protein